MTKNAWLSNEDISSDALDGSGRPVSPAPLIDGDVSQANSIQVEFPDGGNGVRMDRRDFVRLSGGDRSRRADGDHRLSGSSRKDRPVHQPHGRGATGASELLRNDASWRPGEDPERAPESRSTSRGSQAT